MISIYEKYSLGFSSTPMIPKQFTSSAVKKHNQQKLAYLKKRPKELRRSFNNKKKNSINKDNLDKTEKEENQVFEVSSLAPKELENISILFKQSQEAKRKNNLNLLTTYEKEIEKNLRKFTRIKNLKFSFVFDYNNTNIIILYKNFIKFYKNKSKELKKDKIIEVPENLEICEIYMGDGDLKKFTPEECVAIILHELGHVYAHLSQFPLLIKFYAKSLLALGVIMTPVNYLINLLTGNVTGLATHYTVLGAILVLTRSLSFWEHITEYNCDKFAAKYGYGEEMFSVIRKTQLKVTKPKERIGIRNFVKRLLNVGTHPTDTDRLCKLAKSLKKEYKQLYPQLDKRIEKTIGKLNC